MEPLKSSVKVLVCTVGVEPGDTKFLEELTAGQRFVMIAEVPKGSTLVGCVPTPTVLDMVGFSSPAGPPSFVFLTPDCAEKELRVFSLAEHDSEMKVSELVTITPLCTMLMVNVAVVIFEVTDPTGALGSTPLEKVCEDMRAGGVIPVVLRPYKTPYEALTKLMKLRKDHG